MEDDDSKSEEPDERKPHGSPVIGNRTIQIDALTDVQLIDNALLEARGTAPPPLPPKKPARSTAQVVGLVALAAIGGVAFAAAIAHFVFPAPEAPAPTVRHLEMDDETVIRAEPGAD